MRAKTVAPDLAEMVLHELAVIDRHLPQDADARQALATLETFAAFSIELMGKTNPSKVRDIALNLGIRAAWRANEQEVA